MKNKRYQFRTAISVSHFSSAVSLIPFVTKALSIVVLISSGLSLAQADQTVSYTYNPQGLIATLDGARTDVNDIMTFEYDAQGNRTKITNALGQITQITQHDASGRPLRLVDANQVVTVLTYHPRGWLTSISVNGRTTTLDYDAVGQLIKHTRPGGGFTAYTYDDAHRLTDITDSLGNTIHYTLDAAGNLLKEETKDGSGTLTRVSEQEYDQLSRVLLHISGVNHHTQRYQYDENNNLIAQTDARQTSTDRNTAKTTDPLTLDNTQRSSYDALNRLITSIHQQSSTNPDDDIRSDYQYNALDQLMTVWDPNDAQTDYSYNAVGDLLQQDSPDTGLTQYSYDDASNRTSMTDARGITVNYQYDALNRLTFIDYADNSQDVTYTYDSCQHGVGRLCQVQDQSGVTQYSYDSWGNRISESREYQGTTYITRYDYDEDNHIFQVHYPAGYAIQYARNSLGQITNVYQVFTDHSGTLSYNIRYQADGQLSEQTLGSGIINQYSYDLQGRLTRLAMDNTIDILFEKTYTYDANDNLIADNTPLQEREYNYNGLNWLFYENRYSNDFFEINRYHDSNGNLVYQGTEDYYIGTYTGLSLNYVSGSNQLSTLNGTAVQLDTIGNTLADGQGRTFEYNPAGQLWKTYQGTVLKATYTYNSQGQRVQKTEHLTTGDQTTLYFYDLTGQLISEYTNGQPSRDYVWLDSRPLAQVNLAANGSVEKTTYLTTDYLTTPRIGTDEQQNIIWRWESDAYGQDAPTVVPDYQGQTREVNLRFPGQYFDRETGLHYNYYRYYDPQTGRYITSDPIGLDGGLNTYGYVGGNPLTRIDPFGLDWVYNQQSGQLSHQPSASQGGGPPQPVASGYAGIGNGLNNSAAQNQANVGPLPQGSYSIGQQTNSPNTGPGILPLTPDPSNTMFGRHSFQIHGDNRAMNNTASNGCIILNRNMRNQIFNSGDNKLIVLP
ncbi:MAG: RHS repeat-associated core domain-containing protein [Cocleimonas sp.]